MCYKWFYNDIFFLLELGLRVQVGLTQPDPII